MKARKEKERWSNERKSAVARLPMYEHLLDRLPNGGVGVVAKRVEEIRRMAKGE